MNNNQLKELINKNQIPKFMIFIDNNPYNISIYKKQIVKKINLPINYYNDIQEAASEASSLISEDCIYFVRVDNNDKILKKASLFETALSVLKTSGQYSIVVLNDKSKVPKSFINDVIYFDKYDYNSLFSFSKQVCEMNNIKISDAKIQELVEKSDCDLGIATNVLAQLSVLSQIGGDAESFDFCDYRKGNVFTLCDKILSKSDDTWEYSYLLKNDTMMVTFNLYRKARERLKSTNSKYYAKIICECEYIFNGIASGEVKDEYALKYLISNIFEESN